MRERPEGFVAYKYPQAAAWNASFPSLAFPPSDHVSSSPFAVRRSPLASTVVVAYRRRFATRPRYLRSAPTTATYNSSSTATTHLNPAPFNYFFHKW